MSVQLDRSQLESIVEQAEEGYLLLSEEDDILYANMKARTFLDISGKGNEPTGEKFKNLARQKFHLEPEGPWQEWPEQSTSAPGSKRYLIHQDTAKALWLEAKMLESSQEGPSKQIVCLREVTPELTSRRNSWIMEKMLSRRLQASINIVRESMDVFTETWDKLTMEEGVAYYGAARGISTMEEEVKNVHKLSEAPLYACSGSGFHLANLPAAVKQLGEIQGLKNITATIEGNLEKEQLSLTAMGIEIILWELLENAKKFHPDRNPSIEIEVKRFNNSARLTCNNDGKILTLQELERAWLPFNRENLKEPAGSGLFAIASMVWQAGGKCRIYNCTPAPGVAVELDIPLRK